MLFLFSTSISSCCFSFWVCVCVCVCVVVVVMILFFIKTVVTSQEVLCKRWQLCIEEQLLGSSLVPHAGALARMWLMTSWLLRSPHKQPKPPVIIWILFLLSALIPALLAMCSGLCSVQFSTVAQSCLTLCNLMDCSTLGLPVHHQLPEFTQTGVH